MGKSGLPTSTFHVVDSFCQKSSDYSIQHNSSSTQHLSSYPDTLNNVWNLHAWVRTWKHYPSHGTQWLVKDGGKKCRIMVKTRTLASTQGRISGEGGLKGNNLKFQDMPTLKPFSFDLLYFTQHIIHHLWSSAFQSLFNVAIIHLIIIHHHLDHNPTSLWP